jgi:hypothetical protein
MMQSNDELIKALLIVMMSVFAAMAGYIRRIKKAAGQFAWKEFAMELIISMFCAFVAWQLAGWMELQEPLVILIVSMASFAGSKSADFFEDLYFTLIEKLANSRVDRGDKDDKAN